MIKKKVKKFICEKCGTCFARKSRLKIHLMIHSNLKPFECEICKKKFREKSNYNFHKKKHNKNLCNIKNQKGNQSTKSCSQKQNKKLDKDISENQIDIIKESNNENCNTNNLKNDNNNNLMEINDADFCFNPEDKNMKLVEDYEDLFNNNLNQEYIDPNRTYLNSEERILKKTNDFEFIDPEKNDYLEENYEPDKLLDNENNSYSSNNSILNNQFEEENNEVNDNLGEEDFYQCPNEL